VVGKLHMSAERLSISCRSWRRSGDWGHGPQCSYLLRSSRSYRNIGRRDSIWRSVPAFFVTTVLGRSWANVTREVFCGLVFLLIFPVFFSQCHPGIFIGSGFYPSVRLSQILVMSRDNHKTHAMMRRCGLIISEIAISDAPRTA